LTLNLNLNLDLNLHFGPGFRPELDLELHLGHTNLHQVPSTSSAWHQPLKRRNMTVNSDYGAPLVSTHGYRGRLLTRTLGQRALEDSHVLLIVGEGKSSNSSVAGVEALKNLILPSIGHFTIADSAKVQESDLGVNFFLEADSLGKSRSKVRLSPLVIPVRILTCFRRQDAYSRSSTLMSPAMQSLRHFRSGCLEKTHSDLTISF
jgi:hypothetical protein